MEMSLTQAFLEALESLAGNKMRSGLTVLGIVIGVAAVIAMLAVGKGAEESITGSITNIGTNLLFVFRGSMQEGGPNQQTRTSNDRPLTLSDAEALNDPITAPSIVAVAPGLEMSGTLSFGGESTTTRIIGSVPAEFEMRNFKMAEGETISEAHLLERASVVVLGPQTADNLFGYHEGVTGATVYIEGSPFRVIGVFESRGGSAFGSEDNQAFVPFSTARARLARGGTHDEVDIIYVQAISAESVPSAAEEISQILRQRHRAPIGEDDFTVFTQQQFLSTFATITGVLTVFLGGIAGISLLVGGIGIMNIMLVSVTERTREIGLRKALGARRRDILIQFLTESSVLSLVGGIIGILFGWLISFIVGRVAVATGTQFIPVVGLDAILLATIFSAAVGLFFGIYPASRAARLEPVEALRYE
jgi:putative ABC transport system permease protein